jgi:hypothetical protein
MKKYRTALLLLGFIFLTSCEPGNKENEISGIVTYKGQFVPLGMVFFDPVSGTTGSGGFARIKDGKFSTNIEGKGISGGKYDIRILGYDGKSANEAPDGRELFNEYRFQKDLPNENSKLDIEVPAKHK